jgi:PAS domain S-box-containing protein
VSTTGEAPPGRESGIDADLLALLDRLNVPLCVLGRDGRILHISPAMTETLGWTEDDVVGRNAATTAIAPTETDAAVDSFRQVLSGRPWYGSFTVNAKDGTRMTAWWLTAPITAPITGTGSIAGPDDPAAVCMLAGQHDQGMAVSREVDMAEEANLLLDSVVANAPVPLAIFDRELRVVRANEALAASYGRPAWALVGVPVTALGQPLPAELAEDVQSVFATGSAILDKEVRGDGRVWVVSYYPVTLRGEVRWVGAVAIDETDRSRLLAAEQRAREGAEQAADRLSRLQSVTALLSGARTVADVCTVVTHQGMAGVDADNGVLCLLTEDGAELEIAQAIGVQPETRENWSRFPADAPVPAVDAMRSGSPVFFTSIEERDRMYPLFKGQRTANQAFATLPLAVAGRSYGAVTFGWAKARPFSADDRHFLLALAEQCAQALDRCRLYEAEAEDAQRRAFLGEASALLASSLDYGVTMERVARLLLPALADACVVHAIGADGRLELVTAAHVDSGHEQVLRRLAADSEHIARQFRLHEVAVSGRALLVPDIDSSVWDDIAADDAERALLHRLGLHSGLAVPLVASGESVGVLSLAMSVSGRTYSARDVPVAEDLAARAAIAIYNARSHQALMDIAQTLQRSLLPSARPSIPGLDVAAVYRPVSESQVGGDFYDVFPVGEGRWGVVMGDVCGKGVQAASLTALARYTVRTAALGPAGGVGGATPPSPSHVLARLNQAILDEGIDERFCTIAQLLVEPGDERATVTMAVGGHPLPLLLDRAGGLRPVGRPGSGIGMFPDPDLVDTVHTLEPGDALVLYTDGVLEARSPEGGFAVGLLEDALRSAFAAGADAAGLAAAVEGAVLSFAGGHARDDMAVLVVRMPLDSAAVR